MKICTSSKSSLFLIELIIVLLFFAVASAISVSLFARAKLVTRETRALSEACTLCETAVEALRSDDIDLLLAETGAVPQPDGDYLAYYDEHWQPADKAGVFQLRVHLEQGADSLSTVTAQVFDRSGEAPAQVYRLHTAIYQGEGGAA